MNFWNAASIEAMEFLALSWFIAAWVGYAYFAEHRSKTKVTLLTVMHRYRLAWMREMLKRDNRMMDAAMIGNLLRSISFFASTTIFILLALFTLFGHRDQAMEAIGSIPFAMRSTAFLWEMKILVLSAVFIYAFFKYTWSLRQYNYACVLVAGAPPPKTYTEDHEDYAQKSANLTTNAAKHFNMGLRAYYFGLAALTWFIHPLLLMAVTGWVVYVLYRREFRSQTLNNLADAALLNRTGMQQE